MALRVEKRAPRRHALEYHRILVPIVDREISEEAMALAAELAAERKTSVTAVAVIEVPLELPLNAHMFDEERKVRPALADASAIAELHGVVATPRVVRGRSAGEAIVAEAKRAGSELIVLSAQRKSRLAGVFGHTVDYVLRHAPCRVMVAAR
jgi:nucleotide-binding universal stress UspA family protein